MSGLKRKSEDTRSKKRFKNNLTRLNENPQLTDCQSKRNSSYRRGVCSQSANELLGSIMDDSWKMSPVVIPSMNTLFKRNTSVTQSEFHNYKQKLNSKSLADTFSKLSKINDPKLLSLPKPTTTISISKLDFTIIEEPYLNPALISKILRLAALKCLQISVSKKGLLTPIKPPVPKNRLKRVKKHYSRVDDKFLKIIKKVE